MQHVRTGSTTLRTNLADYGITRALKAGEVTSDLVHLDFCGPSVAYEGFKGMVRDAAYDAGELALATFLQAREHGIALTMLPAVMSGRLQHGTIGYNHDFGRLDPRDIEGRRVAVRSYTQTTGLWARGILASEYGVDLDRVTWVCSEDAHVAGYEPPANVERMPDGAKPVGRMLLDGDVDAVILGAEAMPKDPRVRSLIPDPAAAALAWHARLGVMPINHLFVIRTDLVRERPEIVRDIYRMLQDSKRRAGPPAGLDTLPFGYEATRKALELGITFALDQKIIRHRPSVDELFAETAALIDA